MGIDSVLSRISFAVTRCFDPLTHPELHGKHLFSLEGPVLARLIEGGMLPSDEQKRLGKMVMGRASLSPLFRQEFREGLLSSFATWQTGCLRPLREALEKEGFLVRGERGYAMRELNTPQEGIRFVDVAVPLLPSDWDFIDLCERTDWGLWQETKGINATLRSYGEWRTRPDEDGTKRSVLMHPFGNRGNTFINLVYLLGKGEIALERVPAFCGKDFDIALVAQRLQVECAVAHAYMNRPEWWSALFERKDSFGEAASQHKLLSDVVVRIEASREQFLKI